MKNNCHLSLASIMWEYNMFSVWLVTLVQSSHDCATLLQSNMFSFWLRISVFCWAAAGLESAFQLLSCLAIISYIMLWFWAKIYCQVGSPRKAAEGLESDGLGSGRQTVVQLSPRWRWGWWWSSLWKSSHLPFPQWTPELSWLLLLLPAEYGWIWLLQSKKWWWYWAYCLLVQPGLSSVFGWLKSKPDISPLFRLKLQSIIFLLLHLLGEGAK